MIDKCEICFVSTSNPVEHYPYWAVCSDCDNNLWIQSGSEPLSDNKCLSCNREVKGAAILCGGDFCEEKWKEDKRCDVCRDVLSEHCVIDENEKLCHTCWQKKEDLINYGDDV